MKFEIHINDSFKIQIIILNILNLFNPTQRNAVLFKVKKTSQKSE